ncbi:hypothetical protein C8R44DRAFT_987319 [Mycena epipterygia]|nr:hypothetical protein C8R44DRAFT_987319 [Mycena epipterygia]
MSYYHAAPPSPTSSADSFSSGPPRTPTEPDYHPNTPSLILPSLPDYATDPYAQKRPQNTAERRASHNAVERARRETLNARFLDLAALLPNLKHLRRPSKSAIVNSSIAHARAARRYRLLASSQLRALNAECDQVRREVNAWRARANVRPSPTPVRSEGFALVLGGEEPAFDPVDLDAEDDCEEWETGAPKRRAPQAREPACEGPLLLSHPYAKPPTPTPTPSPSFTPAPHTPPHLPTQHTVNMNAPHPNMNMNNTPPPPVAAPFEAPGPFDVDASAYDVNGFLLAQQGEAQWAFAPQGQMCRVRAQLCSRVGLESEPEDRGPPRRVLYAAPLALAPFRLIRHDTHPIGDYDFYLETTIFIYLGLGPIRIRIRTPACLYPAPLSPHSLASPRLRHVPAPRPNLFAPFFQNTCTCTCT